MSKATRNVILAGGVVGFFAVLLVKLGNPANMGFCIACFERDIAGAIGLHRAAVVQYIRPEILGMVLGAMAAALLFKDFRPEGGSAPVVRFFLGIMVMIGALAFLGCPLRMVLRIGGGDLNAIVALGGFITGIMGGVFFLKRGYNLGRSERQSKSGALTLPAVMLILLGLLIWAPRFFPDAESSAIFFSSAGPGSMRAGILIALIAGLAAGFLSQRTRLCLMGGTRDVALVKDSYLVSGFIAILGVTLIGNLILGNFNLGFEGQPVAHTEHLWNFLGMSLVGLGSVLLGGCPLRQLVLSGRGNTDSSLAVIGMVVGAAISHNFNFAASPAGISFWGKTAVLVSLGFCILIGAMNLQRQ